MPAAPEDSAGSSSSSADDYLTPYRVAQELGGSDFGVTLWANPRSQQTRFEVMAQMTRLDGRRVLDAGCSRGDFAAFLLEQDILYRRYIGVDGLGAVIDYAKTRGLRDAEFHQGDFVQNPKLLRIGRPHVVAISGSLNTMDDPTVWRVLEAAWAAARETLIFNFLSDHAATPPSQEAGPARRLDTLALLHWSLRQTWAVRFRHDYFKNGHDATIMMRKP